METGKPLLEMPSPRGESPVVPRDLGSAPEQPIPNQNQGPSWRAGLLSPLWLVPLWALLNLFFPQTGLTTLVSLSALVLVVVCAYTDVRWGKIRNTATYTAAMWAFTLSTLDTLFFRRFEEDDVHGVGGLVGETGAKVSAALGTVPLIDSILGALLALAIMLVVYHLAGGGGGDVKLGAALGALLGPGGAIDVILWTYVAAGVGILVWLIIKVGPVSLLRWCVRRIGARLMPARIAPLAGGEYQVLEGKIRLAPFFAIGTVAYLASVSALLATHFGRG